MAQTVKNLQAIWETEVLSLDWEDPLEKEMATHSKILAWRLPWTEEPGGLQSMGYKELDMTGGLIHFSMLSKWFPRYTILILTVDHFKHESRLIRVMFLDMLAFQQLSSFSWLNHSFSD